MGKPYELELQHLSDTYAASMKIDIRRLRDAVARASSLPLVAVGSGGSLSAAHFVAALHQRFTRKMAKAVTPLELIEDTPLERESAVWCLSASGRNSDINNAFKAAALNEFQELLVACAQTKSPLSRMASQYRYTDIFDFNLPSGKDGFLATNSLLAFVIVFARAYHELFAPSKKLPENIWGLLGYRGSADSYFNKLQQELASLWDRDHFVVLHGSITRPAAHDIESKFTEAALGSVLLADYRNFAHGRHHWLAKRGNTSAVIALTTDADKELAQKTMNLLPNDIPSATLYFPGEMTNSSIASMIGVLHVVAHAGKARGIDPGRPGVPTFGRRIYHLRGIKNLRGEIRTRQQISVQRKVNVVGRQNESMSLKSWIDAYNTFLKKLERTRFAAAIFDYDGTLCDRENRFGSLDHAMAKELKRLLSGGIGIGIATGRGKSVRHSLQKALPKSLWKRVLVGYYNGADCGLLCDDHIPDGSDMPCKELEPVANALINSPELKELCEVTVRRSQITIESLSPIYLEALWNMVNQIVQQHGTSETRVVTSSHSVDILAPEVSKKAVVKAVRNLILKESGEPILCIGDRGRWPGNDFELLQEPLSLSVDDVSYDQHSCWNLAKPGYRGVQAALEYLKCMRVGKNGLQISFEASSE